MKRILFAGSLIILSACLNFFQGQTWQWAREEQAGPEGLGVCTDNLGNVFAVGYISGTASVGNYSFANSGVVSALIIKYDPDGNVLWANNCPGNTSIYGWGVACDASGNVFLGGHIPGSTVVGSQTLVSTGSSDMLLVKYSPAGVVIWAVNIGGTGQEV